MSFVQKMTLPTLVVSAPQLSVVSASIVKQLSATAVMKRGAQSVGITSLHERVLLVEDLSVKTTA